nr:MAG TPA: hypothetical protein [Caudoviricetes sp.]
MRVFRTNVPEGIPDPFEDDAIQAELKDRVNHKAWPNQYKTSLCGPAAFFYCLLKDFPHSYKQVVTELSREGESRIGGLELKVGKASRVHGFFDGSNEERISAVDWITLGVLRNSSNWIFKYNNLHDVGTIMEGLTCFTTHWEVARWFSQSGRVDVRNLATPFCVKGMKLKKLIELNKLYNEGYKIVFLLNPLMVFNRNFHLNLTELHWVVWESAVVDQVTRKPIDTDIPLNTLIDLDMFTWGRVERLSTYNGGVKTASTTLGELLEASRGAIVFK